MLHNAVKPEMTQAWRAVLVVLALGEMAPLHHQISWQDQLQT